MRMRATNRAGWVILLATARVAVAAPAAAAEPVAGRIEAVTVYRGQALVTRVIDAAGPAGLREVVVTGLPERIVPASLFAEADAGVEVRGLRFRTRPVSQDVREDVRQLEAKVRDDGDAQTANGRRRRTLTERRSYLDRLEQFSAPTAGVELKNGVLNAETLKTLTLFLFEQRTAIADEELKLEGESRDLAEQAAFLRRQLNELTSGATKSIREAVILADFKAGAGPLRVKYLVDSATWSPSYVARADTGKARRAVTVEYNAAVQQQSGEDWADVAMTLSTATPSLVAAAPELEPLAIRLTAAQPEAAAAPRERYVELKQKLYVQRSQVEVLRNSNASAAGNLFGGGGRGDAAAQTDRPSGEANDIQARQDAELNGIAGQLQKLELVSRDAAKDSAERGPAAPAARQEGVSVTYTLPGRTSLPSRQDQQSVRISVLSAEAEFYKLALPVLTGYVYDQATLANPGPAVLLAGPVASYRDGQYVGSGTLPTVATGEKFTVGFGIDASLRASRELVEKTETTQAGNRVMTFTYRLAVENFGKTPAVVRLTDRLPTSPDGDVKVTLVSKSQEPTTQPTAEPPTPAAAKRAGVIAWGVSAPAEAVGDKAAVVQYGYKLEFDKQLGIAK